MAWKRTGIKSDIAKDKLAMCWGMEGQGLKFLIRNVDLVQSAQIPLKSKELPKAYRFSKICCSHPPYFPSVLIPSPFIHSAPFILIFLDCSQNAHGSLVST